MYNQIYKLDSYGAYQKDLVKRIEVKTVHGVIPKDYPYIRYLSFTSDLKAKIEIFSQEQGGIIRFNGCNSSIAFKDLDLFLFVPSIFCGSSIMIIGLIYLISSQGIRSTYEIEKNEAVRIQIRLAIQNHFVKQMNILRTGRKIKTLTLFFIDSVDKVRDQTAPD